MKLQMVLKDTRMNIWWNWQNTIDVVDCNIITHK